MKHEEKLANNVFTTKYPGRKNNDLVAAMYALYLTGKSLKEVGDIYRKTRQCVYDIFRTRGYELRSKKLKGLQILDGIQFTLTKGGYLRGTVGEKRMLMHHYVWQKHTGQTVEKGYNIHHKDENKENNNIENLEYLTASEHTKKYGKFLNQFTSPTGSRIWKRHKLFNKVRLAGSKKYKEIST